MKRLLLSLLFLVSIVQLSFCCSWFWISFCSTAAKFDQNLIVSGHITSIDDDGIDLEVITVLRGVEDRSVIRIWDGTDFDCNGIHPMAASELGERGDTIIVLLPKIDSIENSWDQLGDYRMPMHFGDSPFLAVRNNMVNGFISYSSDTSSMYLREFPYEAYVESWQKEMDCSKIVAVDKVQNTLAIQLYPNPASTSLSLKLDKDIGRVNVSLYNLAGSKLHSQSCSSEDRHILIDRFVPGIYIARITKEGTLIQSEKFVKL